MLYHAAKKPGVTLGSDRNKNNGFFRSIVVPSSCINYCNNEGVHSPYQARLSRHVEKYNNFCIIASVRETGSRRELISENVFSRYFQSPSLVTETLPCILLTQLVQAELTS